MVTKIGHRQAKATHDPCVAPEVSNICAIVVTFFPDGQLSERLERIRPQVSKIIIVDNTGAATPATSFEQPGSKGLEIIHNDKNLGIAQALNQGIQRAMELGYLWIICFDQDTYVHADLVENLIAIYLQQPRPETIGIIGCNFEDRNIGACPNDFSSDEKAFLEVETVITSGSMISAPTFLKAGPFRSDFFIDFVDNEYCLRLRKLGYTVLTSTAPLMSHSLGAATQDFKLGKITFRRSNRSALRRYYMTRNALLVARYYFSVAPRWILGSLTGVLVFAVLKIPMERQSKWKKFRATLYGIYDALRGKTGEPQTDWLAE